jgi:hypothetical protein
LSLAVSTIGIANESGDDLFPERLSMDLLAEDREWFAVLRGQTSDARVRGAVVVTKLRVDFIFNLPSGISIVSSAPGRPSEPSDVPEHQTASPPFYVSEILGEESPETGGSRLLFSTHPTNGTDTGHSVVVSKHIWDSNPIDPMNVMFYGKYGWHGARLLESLGAWAWNRCGGDKNLWMADGRHGGTDHWGKQTWHYGTDGGWCFVDRYHGREYFPSDDTHLPGFAVHSPHPVHWECWTHDLGCVYPQRGQDWVLSYLSPRPVSQNLTVGHIHSFLLSDNKDCATCARWDGWVDLYEIRRNDQTTPDPCGADKPTISQFDGDVKLLGFFC